MRIDKGAATMSTKSHVYTSIFVDPSYPVFEQNRLFDLSDRRLNRDDQLLPYHRVRESMRLEGVVVSTSDYLFVNQSEVSEQRAYISLGNITNYQTALKQQGVHLSTFVIMEPPVVAPKLYSELSKLTKFFDRVYVHNVVGDGYSLDGVDTTRLKKLFLPIPYNRVLEPYWDSTNRLRRIVVINGNHKPQSKKSELYSKRIEAIVALQQLDVVDLFGRDWNKWWSRESLWIPYWGNRKKLLSVYKGSCDSKFEVLAQYDFCLCFENMTMSGYISEKLFDCLYAGTIPIYLGAPDVADYIPTDVYIDCRNFQTWDDLWDKLNKMSTSEVQMIREAGRRFLISDAANIFFDSLSHLFREINA